MRPRSSFMASWLIGIGIAGFFVSLMISASMRPKGVGERLGRSAVGRWWVGSLATAVAGVGLALLFAWPAWLLGRYLGPYFDVSGTAGGAIFACIFGLGGAALTGAISVGFNERF